jgi:hypothetical protein
MRRVPLLSVGVASTSHMSNATTIQHLHLYRTDAIVGLVLLALVVFLWIPRLSGPIDLRWDASVYYILGTSLAEGKGYRLLNEPGEIEAVQYPPLLPLIVAAHQWVLETNDPMIVGQWLRLSFFLMFAAYSIGIYLMLRGYHLPWNYAFPGTLVCLFSLQTYFMSDLLFPEIPFALVTVLFFLCSQKSDEGIYPVLAGVFAVLAYTLRTIGIALLLAWVAEGLLKRQFKRAAARATLSLIPVLCWQTYISFVESGAAYQRPAYAYQRADYSFYNVSYNKNIFRLKDSFSPELGKASIRTIAERFISNVVELQTALGGAISIKNVRPTQWAQLTRELPFLPLDPWPVYLSLMFFSSIILAGIGLQLANREWLIPVYVGVSLAAICLTPWPGQFQRYLMPLAPFLSLSFFRALRTVRARLYTGLRERWKVLGTVFVCAVVAVIFVQQAFSASLVFTRWHQQAMYSALNGTSQVYRLFFYHDAYRTLDGGLDWLRERANPSDVVAVSMPHWAYLRTGLKTVMPPFEADPVKAQQFLDSVPVSYLIIADELAVDTRKYTSSVVQYFPGRWQRVYSTSVISELGEKLQDRFEIYKHVEPPMFALPALNDSAH